jgi:hypothetical protein
MKDDLITRKLMIIFLVATNVIILMYLILKVLGIVNF